MNVIWRNWKSYRDQHPRAVIESVLVIAFLCLVLFFYFKQEIFLALFLFAAGGSLLSRGFRQSLAFAWWSLGLILGKFTSPVILAGLFFLILTPWSFLFRAFNKDPLRFKKKYSTQWNARRHGYTNEDFRNPF